MNIYVHPKIWNKFYSNYLPITSILLTKIKLFAVYFKLYLRVTFYTDDRHPTRYLQTEVVVTIKSAYSLQVASYVTLRLCRSQFLCHLVTRSSHLIILDVFISTPGLALLRPFPITSFKSWILTASIAILDNYFLSVRLSFRIFRSDSVMLKSNKKYFINAYNIYLLNSSQYVLNWQRGWYQADRDITQVLCSSSILYNCWIEAFIDILKIYSLYQLIMTNH